ncbi:MAG TPA: GAF domain-containing sensor histidine kinase [Gemmatimonadaceae bacterium]
MSEIREQERVATRQDGGDENEIVSTLARIGAVLTSGLDLQAIVQTVTDETTQLTGAEFGAFFYNVLNEAGESYTLYTLSGAPCEAFANFPTPRATAVFAPTFHGTEVVRSADITKDSRYGKNAPYYGKPAGHLPVVSYLAVPVISRSGTVLGGLFFGHSKPNVFTARDERLVVGTAGWAAVAMDNARLLADAVAARDEAERARKQAEHANRSKAEFLAAMSHELRTPLNAIAGYAQILEMGIQGALNDSQREMLSRMQRSQRALLTLIEELLGFAQIESGKVVYRMSSVTIAQLLDDIELMIAPQLSPRKVRFHIESCDPDISVWADREKVDQTLLNLITNAIKFTERGEIAVTCTASEDAVEICVRDTGVGIDPERTESIFEPFVQFDGGYTRTSHGTGLGLTISRTFARAMGGDVRVVSVLGEGSSFMLTLPRNRPAE